MDNAPSSATAIDPRALAVLRTAVEAEQSKRYLFAVDLYSEGIKLLIDNCRATTNEKIKAALKEKIRQYLEHAEALKRTVEQEKKKSHGYHEQLVIQENGTGFGLERVFGPYLDGELTEVEIDDAYIRHNHQIQLFLKFCALIIKKSPNVKHIRLKTSCDGDPAKKHIQVTRLDEIRLNLLQRGIFLLIEYCDTLHDREIRFDNGWIIKIGRGLDYFKRAEPNTVEFFELDFRPCMATTVDMIYKPKRAPFPSASGPSTSGSGRDMSSRR
ncbi:MIT domain-containing protein 1-like [Paramacrobiotus metropolitanus]|uniref:MIT domain-containing protein 1-like n=1 Tax=Paramacrobiotus metropolitanus TaxID=2943436 RepID=UPI002445A94B|nr:MIT domain-containing protein 1-like [Paramacrobiotus metropolitanus]